MSNMKDKLAASVRQSGSAQKGTTARENRELVQVSAGKERAVPAPESSKVQVSLARRGPPSSVPMGFSAPGRVWPD
jgi:hypothetical protein